MSKIRASNTKPELAVRRMLHRLGYRYRIDFRALPGRPDIVFTARKKIVFVHGCFWHRHAGCRFAYEPKTRRDFWSTKFARNIARDAEVKAQLESLGWEVLVIWECQTRDIEELERRLTAFLGPPNTRELPAITA